MKATIAAMFLMVSSMQAGAMTVERAEKLLAVLGQAQQCVGIGVNAGWMDESKRLDEVFEQAGRELATALIRGEVQISNTLTLPPCLWSVTNLKPQNDLSEVDQAFAVGFSVGSAQRSCTISQVDKLTDAVPLPAQFNKEQFDKWSQDQANHAQLLMRQRTCTLVQLP